MFGDFKRYPILKNDPLRAWDAADELLVDEVRLRNPTSQRILILNDTFGAISSSLSDLKLTVFTDSYLSYKATVLNSKNKIVPISHLAKLDGKFDFVLMRIPKNLSFFEDLLQHLSKLLNSSGQVICTSMVKHLPKSIFPLLEKYIGTTHTSLAKKKARLIFSRFEKEAIDLTYPQLVKIEDFPLPFTHYSNLFSREKLDIGTRFFLENIPKGDFKSILDLGCANGIVGIKAKMLNPVAKIYFTDESFMAIQSAETNYQKYFSDEPELIWTNSFESGESQSMDLILCNPPFHAQHVVGDFIAREMFRNARRVLKENGQLLVIGNRHLGYHVTLRQYFSKVNLLAENSKFVIFDARLK